jgi:Concanavalin A-like lectin/glucanases superfamily
MMGMYVGRGLVAIAVVIAMGGCHVADIDLTGKQCPCAVGFQCDDATNTCVRGIADAATDDAIDGDTMQGLQFWFKLDEASGTTVTDSSGHAGDGALMLAHDTWLPTGGKLHGALHADGSAPGTCVPFPASCTTNPTFTTALTVAGWVNFDRFQTAPYSLGDFAVVQGTSGGMEGGWGVGATDKCGTETLGFEVTAPNDSNRNTRCGTTVIALGTWYHVTGVYDGASGRQDLYVGGVKEAGPLMGTTPAMLAHPPGCPKLVCPSNNMNVMAGTLDEIRVYDRALSDDEVVAVFHASGG